MNTLDDMRTRLDAEKYYELAAMLEEAIKEDVEPAEALHSLTVETFGERSPQALSLEANTAAREHPGGYELTIATIRQQKAVIKNQQKKMTEMSKALADELARLEKAEAKLNREKTEAGGLDLALLEVMTACTAPERPTLAKLAELFDRCKGRREAMGLLYGHLENMAREAVFSMDMVDYQKLNELKGRVLEAVTA